MKKILFGLLLSSLVFVSFVSKTSADENHIEVELEQEADGLNSKRNYSGGSGSIGGNGGSYYKYFVVTGWVQRSNGITLSISPTRYLAQGNRQVGEDAFRVLLDFHGKDKYWKNTASMKKQFLCHMKAGLFKTPWNIEPWRTNSGWNCN